MWVFSDGGRAAAGWKGTAGDCVCRANTIATQRAYEEEVYTALNTAGKDEWLSKRRKAKSSARTGVHRPNQSRPLHNLHSFGALSPWQHPGHRLLDRSPLIAKMI